MISSDDVAFFAVVARSSSLAAAARHLDVTASAVTQRLQDLERRLRVRLVYRTGRQLTLTDEGELLAQEGAGIVEALSALTDAIQARQGLVTGRLRVVAPLGFGRAHIAPLVHAFTTSHPGLTVELTLSDRLGRIPTSAWDVAVHIGELRDSSLIARRVAPNARICCAAPALLAQFEAPRTPADLARLPCLAIRENDEDTTLWRFNSPQGTTTVRIDPVFASNDGEVVREWALAGVGVIVRSEWSVADDLATGRLVRLLPRHPLPPADIVALVPSRTGHSARASRFVDFLRAHLVDAPWRRDLGRKS